MKALRVVLTWLWGALSGASLAVGVYCNIGSLVTVGYFSTACFVAGVLSWLIVKLKGHNV